MDDLERLQRLIMEPASPDTAVDSLNELRGFLQQLMLSQIASATKPPNPRASGKGTKGSTVKTGNNRNQFKPKIPQGTGKAHKKSVQVSDGGTKSTQQKTEQPGKQKPSSAAKTDQETKSDPAERHLAAESRPKPTTLVVKRVATIARTPPSGKLPRNSCAFCQLPPENKQSLREHFATVHGKDFSLDPVLRLDAHSQRIDRQVFYIRLVKKSEKTPTFHLGLTNVCAAGLVLRSVQIFDGNRTLVPVFEDLVLRMVPKYSLEEEIMPELEMDTERKYSLIIVATPLIEEKLNFQLVEQFHFKLSNNWEDSDDAKFTQLKKGAIPPEIRQLYQRKFENNGSLPSDLAKFLARIERYKELNSVTAASYKEQLTLLNNIEEQHIKQEFSSYTIQQPKLKATNVPGYYMLSIHQFKVRPTLLKEDTKLKLQIELKGRHKILEGTVEKVEFSYILLCIRRWKVFHQKYVKIHKVDFEPDLTTLLLEYNALDRLGEQTIEQLAFPQLIGQSKVEPIEKFEWLRETINSNVEQVAAVRNIVNQTAFPAPYILFGPPGTGKTSTIVEAVGQIYKLHPKANILVAATSNFAANELTIRLIHVLPEKQIFRYFSKSSMRTAHDVDGGVLNVSNVTKSEESKDDVQSATEQPAEQLTEQSTDQPTDKTTTAYYDYRKLTYKGVYSCRVVVCTLTTAGRLVQASIAAKHFSYIFVDECGSAKEISSLVPIVGLATLGDEVTASVILAGDPHQLGPVIMYDYLKQTSHATSMLERLIEHKLYRKNSTTQEYNNLVITQLRDNFRSHPAILQYANEAFYEGRLRAKASPEVAHWALGWHALTNQQFPILFHPLVGRTLQSKTSTSLFNAIEANQVMSYVQDILMNGVNGRQVSQNEIGIISPYARQVSHLKQCALKRKWPDIEIGSVEQYQGREKPIIIVSTVRTRCKTVGFLSNVKRLNVTLTRAQALMIIVGDAETLENDYNWKRLIEYCRTNRAIVSAQATAEVQEKHSKTVAAAEP